MTRDTNEDGKRGEQRETEEEHVSPVNGVIESPRVTYCAAVGRKWIEVSQDDYDFVRAAAAASITTGAESKNSLR